MFVMSQEEVEYWFYFQENIIDIFVVENLNGEVMDFLSFYMLFFIIMNYLIYKSFKVVYFFYNVYIQIFFLDFMSDVFVFVKMVRSRLGVFWRCVGKGQWSYGEYSFQDVVFYGLGGFEFFLFLVLFRQGFYSFQLEI